MKIAFNLNGEPLSMDLSGDERVLDILRERVGIPSCREGCGTGECGACTVLVDGESRLSCLMVSAQLDGKTVTTVEGVRDLPRWAPLFDSFDRLGAVQCGYCTPGMVLAAVDLLTRNPDPSRDEVRIALSGNICRCTGYRAIVDAVMEGAEIMRGLPS